MRGVEMDKRKKREKNIQRYMLKTYLVMAFISVFVSIILCVFMVIRANQSVVRSSQNELDKIKLQMDHIFENVNDVLAQLCESDLVGSISGYSPDPVYRGEIIMDIQELMTSFESDMDRCEFISNIYLLDDTLTTMIDSQSIYHDSDCADVLEEMELEEAQLSEAGTSNAAFLHVIQSGTPSARLFFIRGIYRNSYKAPDGYLIIEGDMNRIMEALRLFTSANGERCYLVSKADGYIGTDSEGDSIVSNQKIQDQEITSGYFWSDRSLYTYAVVPSDYLDLEYCYVISALSYYEETIIVVVFTVVSTVILLVSSVLLAWRFTKKNTEPLQAISKVLGQTRENTALTSYDQMLRDASDLNFKVKRYEESQDKNYLSQILLGQEKNTEKVAEYEKHWEALIRDGFYILTVKVENINETSDANILTFCIRNVFGEILSGNTLLYPVESWDRVYFLIQGEVDELREKIGQGIQYVDTQLEIQAVCGVSGQIFSFQDIGEEKRRADYMVEYVELTPELRKQMWYSEVVSDEHWNPQNFRSELNKLMHMILIQDYSESRKLLAQIWKEHIYVPDMAPDRTRGRMMSVRYIIQIPYREFFGNNDFQKPEKTLSEMYTSVDTMLYRLENNEEPEGGSRSAYEKLRDYISEHATDPSITAGSVSETFNLSASYASGMFKKYAGEGILDAIHKERIRQAKSLLKEGLSVQETARKVGYLDARGFIRTFKKYEGITPGQYKNL